LKGDWVLCGGRQEVVAMPLIEWLETDESPFENDALR
jgi:hypothetical protein